MLTIQPKDDAFCTIKRKSKYIRGTGRLLDVPYVKGECCAVFLLLLSIRNFLIILILR